MWAVSDRWDKALRVSHNVITTAELWQGGSRLTLPSGSTSLMVTAGSVTVDESSKVRRSLSLTVADVALEPVAITDTLAAPDVDVKVWTGLSYTEGDTETPPVGVFRLTDVNRSSYTAGLDLLAADYSSVLADARFEAPWSTPAGTGVSSEIKRMALDALPNLTVIDLSGSSVLTTAASWEKDRWDAMLSLAKSIGCEVFFDQVGRLIIRPVPQVTSSTTAVWTVDAGTSTSVMTEVATAVSTKLVYNGVIATSSAQGISVSAGVYQAVGRFAYSSTFKRPRYYASPMLTTYEQCVSAASAILARSVAFARQITPQAVPNPALDVGDPVLLVMPNGVTETRILSKITLPLTPAAMALDTRVATSALSTSDVGSLS